jgi:hypothetical protein
VFDAREKDKAFKKRELDRAKEVAQEREREEHNRSVIGPSPRNDDVIVKVLLGGKERAGEG